jgi:N-acyl-D-amino-acid deacylase
MISMSEEYDILIKNATIVDGTGSPAYKGALSVQGERIAAIGKVEGELKGDAKNVIDAEGLTVTPGFIDVHNHGDLSILYYPKADGFVRQGITSFVGGQCGDSPGPFGDYIGLPWVLGDVYADVADKMYYKDWLQPRDLINPRHKELYGWEIDWNTMGGFFKKLEKTGLSPNYVPLVGHGDVRSLVMGPDFKRTATKKEITEMRKHVDQAMLDGCRGISVGRDYDPGIYAKMDELVGCAKAAAKYDGVYASHSLRTGHRKAREIGVPGPVPMNGVLEAIDVGRQGKMSVQVSHLGTLYQVSPGGNKDMTMTAIKSTLKVIDDAVEEGLDVNFDVIPHHAAGGIGSSPYMIGPLKPWLKVAGSPEQFVKSLKMEDFREEIKATIRSGKWYSLNPNMRPTWANGSTIMECKEKRFIDKTIAQIAEELEVEPLDALFKVIMADPETKGMRKAGSDWAKLEYFKHPRMMVGIDTFAVDHTRESRHFPPSYPSENSFGGFARYLRRAVRETDTLSVEEAVRKITSSPARKFKMTDRGVLKPGAYADIVAVNMETVTDKGNALEPRQYPEGIEYVAINGKLVVDNSKHTGALPGKILYRE